MEVEEGRDDSSHEQQLRQKFALSKGGVVDDGQSLRQRLKAQNRTFTNLRLENWGKHVNTIYFREKILSQ